MSGKQPKNSTEQNSAHALNPKIRTVDSFFLPRSSSNTQIRRMIGWHVSEKWGIPRKRK